MAYKGMKVVAIIPARQGSKGLKNKNIMKMLGKPLIAHSILHAKKSRYVDEVFVTSDSDRILSISEKFGAQPIKRPKALATDKSAAILAYKHAIASIRGEGVSPSIVAILQPTSALRDPGDIDRMIELLVKRKPFSVISVYKESHPLEWVFTLSEQGCLRDIVKSNIQLRQQAPKRYKLNGSITVIFADNLMKKSRIRTARTLAYLMPKERSVDIDDWIDFTLAEQLMKKQGKTG